MIPTIYTESTLAAYMLTCLKDVATQMAWTTLTDVQEAVNEALLAYGVTDVASASDIRKVRKLARREIWRQVASATAGNFAFSADGASFSRQQIHEHAMQEFNVAVAEAAEYDGFSVKVVKVDWTQDPFEAGFDELDQ